MTHLPDINTAMQLWHQSILGFTSNTREIKIQNYIFHTTGVATSAYKIAQQCGMDPNKAYILGLLHDYGKIKNERENKYPHFLLGFDEMSALGYKDVAKISLTHSFPIKDFKLEDYPSFDKKHLILTKQLLSTIEYDEYDKLIQLCDMFFAGLKKVTFQERIKDIELRYNITSEQTKILTQGAAANKQYFDSKCGCDIYTILNM